MEQARQRLCSTIIRDHFGQTAEKIFNKLLNGRQTFNKLLLYLINDGGSNNDENKLLLKKSLKTMIQHHVVKYYRNDDNKMYYESDIDSVEMRLHFPHYINIIKQYNLEYAYLIIKYLCQNGQCTRHQLFDLFANDIYTIIDKKIIKNDNKNIKKEDDDNDNSYSFSSLQFNDDNNNNEWIRSLLKISKQDRINHFRKQFKIIWNFLLNKSFIIQQKIQQQNYYDADNTNLKKRKRVNNNDNDIHDEDKRIGPNPKMYVSSYIFIHYPFT